MARELKITVTVDGAQAKTVLADVDRTIDGVTQNTETMAKSMQAALGILTAQNIRQFVTDLRAAGSEFVTAFAEQESATRKLTAALQTQGNATPAVISQYGALASQFEHTTVFADELILEMEALLVQVGNVAPAQMDKALKAATDLASGLGIDLRTATLLVGKAFEGHTETLGRYGITLDQTKLKADPVAAVLEGINNKFGGQAQAQLDTYTGKMAQFHNEMNNVEESAGGLLVGALKPLLELFESFNPVVQTTILGIIALGTALTPVALSFVTLVPGLKLLIPLIGESAVTAGLAGAAIFAAQAVALVGVAFGSWKIGQWIGEISGLTDVVGRLAAQVMGVSGETYDAMRSAQQWEAIVAKTGGRSSKGDIELTPGVQSTGLTGMYDASDALKRSLLKPTAPRIDPDVARVMASTAAAGSAGTETSTFLGKQLEQAYATKATLLEPLGPASALDHERTLALLGSNAPGSPTGTAHENVAADSYARARGVALGSQMHAGIADSMHALPQTIMSALTGGGDVGRSIGALFGGNIVGSLSGHLTSGLSSMFGKTIGGALGSVIPGLGTMLGSMIGPLIGTLGKKLWNGIQGIFGKDEEARVVNPARDEFMQSFVQEFGGNRNDATIKALEAAGLGGERAAALMAQLNVADTMQEFNAAKSAIEAALKSTDRAVENVTDSTKDFNLQLTGSDDAIKALGATQDRVVAAMLTGFDKLMIKLDAFIGRLTDAGKAAATIATGAIGAGADVQFTLPVDSGRDLAGITEDVPIESFHSGGMVWRRAHRGMMLGPDEVPIIAQTGERVLNRAETRAYNSGGVNLHVAPGGIVVQGAGKSAGQIADELIPELYKRIGRYNTGGSKRKMGRAVGFPSPSATS